MGIKKRENREKVNHEKTRIVKKKEIKDDFAAIHFLSGEVLPVTVDNPVTDQHQKLCKKCGQRRRENFVAGQFS